jgi:hypothetical protein
MKEASKYGLAMLAWREERITYREYPRKFNSSTLSTNWSRSADATK